MMWDMLLITGNIDFESCIAFTSTFIYCIAIFSGKRLKLTTGGGELHNREIYCQQKHHT